MPTYQYACTSCGERIEVVQKFSDDPLTVCPACSGALRKVFSPVGVVFKGSGFYKTDSRTTPKSTSSSGTAETKSSDSASTTTADSGASKSSEAKPTDKPASGGAATTSGQVA